MGNLEAGGVAIARILGLLEVNLYLFGCRVVTFFLDYVGTADTVIMICLLFSGLCVVNGDLR